MPNSRKRSRYNKSSYSSKGSKATKHSTGNTPEFESIESLYRDEPADLRHTRYRTMRGQKWGPQECLRPIFSSPKDLALLDWANLKFLGSVKSLDDIDPIQQAEDIPKASETDRSPALFKVRRTHGTMFYLSYNGTDYIRTDLHEKTNWKPNSYKLPSTFGGILTRSDSEPEISIPLDLYRLHTDHLVKFTAFASVLLPISCELSHAFSTKVVSRCFDPWSDIPRESDLDPRLDPWSFEENVWEEGGCIVDFLHKGLLNIYHNASTARFEQPAGFLERFRAGLIRREQVELFRLGLEVCMKEMSAFIFQLIRELSGEWYQLDPADEILTERGSRPQNWEPPIIESAWSGRVYTGHKKFCDRNRKRLEALERRLQGFMRFIADLRCESIETRILRYVEED
ncbi:hypothetical protein BJ508DRAFT_419218 [Ascobolus immersus RN42]|uniref:Uncharacterized protein n=1 Tax=Ascobolus immersus RN42 TaxID=1160509 RepID=A0A3N4HFJ6_ASCIM|nr:hypothetical protein BJ508DRAFT_419218 [Ascobolus immersus RN42]